MEGNVGHHIDLPTRFQQRTLLGRGAMGEVWSCLDEHLGEEVAVKVLPALDAEGRVQLKREFRIASRFVHPNLVRLYELHDADGQTFFTMERVDGCSFVDWVREGLADGQGLPDGALGRLMDGLEQLSAGLAALHGHGVVHRDVKPTNVIVDERVRLLDFGLSVAMYTGEARSAGSLAYAAPEQLFAAEADALSDHYSVGALLFECLGGHWEGLDTPELLMAKVDGRQFTPERLPAGTPDGLIRAVAKLTMADPLERVPLPDVLRALRRDLGLPARDVMGSGGGRPIGREAERAWLVERVQRAAAKGRCVAHVWGTPGMGKRSLVRSVLMDLASRESGPLLLETSGHRMEHVPFRTFDALADAVSEMAALAGVTQVPGALRSVFSVFSRFELDPDRVDGIVDPRQRRWAAYDQLAEVLGAVAGDRTVVVWVADTQWADEASIPPLRALVESPAVAKMLVVFTGADPTDSAPFHEALRGTMSLRVPAGDVLEVVGLPAQEAREVVRRAAGVVLDDAACDAVIDGTDGSTWMLEDRARALARGDRSADLQDQVGDALVRVVAAAPGGVPWEVALEAAGQPPRGRLRLYELEVRGITRGALDREGAWVKVAHEAVRDEVLGALSPDELRALHGAIATALRAQETPDPTVVVAHLRAAGDGACAGALARDEADAHYLREAFERAAVLYGIADGLGALDDLDDRERWAQALAHAGEAARAGEAFLALADAAPGDARARTWRLRSAELRLLTGHIEEGLDAMAPALRDVGMPVPRHIVGTVVSLATNHALASWRVGRWRAGRKGARHERDAEVAALCWSAGRGLGNVMPLEGACFQLRSLVRSLRTSDPHLVGRSLAFHGALIASGGGASLTRGLATIARAEQMGEEADDAYVVGMARMYRAQAWLFEGRWRDALESALSAESLIRVGCVGAWWEQNIALGTILLSRDLMGDIDTVRASARRWQREADARHDGYARVTARLFLGYCALCDADIPLARTLTDEVEGMWVTRGFSVQDLYVVRNRAMADVMHGDPASGLARFDAAWPAIRSSFLMRIPVTRIDIRMLETRLLLAQPDAEASYARRLDAALKDLGRIRRVDVPLLVGLFEGLRAGRRDPDRALARLDEAAEGFTKVDMALLAAVARYRAAACRSDGPGRAAARLALRGCGVGQPDRFVDCVAPWQGVTPRLTTANSEA